MANFQTHLTVASAVSAVTVSSLLAAGACSPGQAVVLWALGSGAGLLPDIDSDTSRSIRWIFNTLAVIAALITLLCLHRHLSLPWLWCSMALVYVTVRFIAMPIFAACTVHRGLFHSLLSLPLYGSAAALISAQVFGQSATLSWIAAAFVMLGATIHLLLDELYAVDLEGARLKASFGSAMKLFSLQNPAGSLIMLVVVVILFSAAPPLEPAVQYLSAINWTGLI